MKILTTLVLAAFVLFTVRANAAVFNVLLPPYNAPSDGKIDAYPAIQRAVDDAVRFGPGSVVSIPAGTYLLDSGKTIHIENANGISIVGSAQTELINGKQNDFIAIDRSSNIQITMLKTDSQPLRSTQGVVDAVAADGKSITVTLDPGFQGFDAPLFASASPSRSLDCFFWTDPECIAFDRQVGAAAIGFSRLSASQWTVLLNGSVSSVVVGKKFAVLNEGGGWPLSLNDNTGPIRITDLTYYGGGGSGAFIGINRNYGPITIEHCFDTVPPGSGRLLASAGGFTAQGDRGPITVDNCDISRTKDDILDTGTDLAHILAHPAPNQIVVENSEDYLVGDTVQLWDWTPQMQHVKDTANVTAASKNGNASWNLTLDHPVTISKTGDGPGDTNWNPQENDGIDRCIDLEDGGRITFTNNKIQDSGRVLVMKSPNSVIANNFFYSTPWCIFAAAETFWHGGPAPLNLTIKDNMFQDIDICPIEVEVRYSNSSDCCKNITITGNKFRHCGEHGPYADGVYGPMIDVRGAGIRLRSTDGAVVSDNSFFDNWGVPIIVQDSKNVAVTGNKFLSMHTHMWSNWKNYGVDQGADIYLDCSNTVTLSGNTTVLEGPNFTQSITATPTCTQITGLKDGVKVN